MLRCQGNVRFLLLENGRGMNFMLCGPNG
jgi:hypothetical protein